MKKRGAKILIILIAIIILIVGIILLKKVIKGKDNEEVGIISNKEEMENNIVIAGLSEKKETIFSGNDRPIAIMIDNHKEAWPQAGIQEAYMVYEIIAEGGETRLMALLKGANVDKIGPVRSARHYFIDYVMENDAIYTHFGQSPQAESDIKKYNINNVNGIYEDGVTFWRVKDKNSPHNAVTSTEKILESAKKKKYNTTSSKESVLKYATDEVNLEEGEEAMTITIPHSNLQTVKYTYNKEKQVYERYARKIEQKDWDTGETITTKNIIITLCDNYTLTDTEKKGRQGLKNIGTFDGYYITNGKSIKIKCTKNARNEKTKYKDLNGKEIEINDGNTFVQICPTDAKIKIEAENNNNENIISKNNI